MNQAKSLSLSFITGLLLTLSFAPFNLWPLAILSLSGLFFSAKHSQSAKQACLAGLLFGLGFFGTSVSWVWVSMHHFGNMYALVAAAFTLVFVLYLSLYTVFYAYAVFCLRALPRLSQLALLPAIWLFAEWTRSHFLSGFPWGLVGYTSLDSTLSGYIPLVGNYGASVLIVLLSLLLCQINWHEKKQSLSALMSCSFIFLVGFGLQHVEWTTAESSSARFAMVQGNINQDLKWLNSNQQAIVDTYIKLSQPYWSQVDYLIWPESAITVPLPFSKTLLDQLNLMGSSTNTTLVTGIPQQSQTNSKQFLNTVYTAGQFDNKHYAKRHLVPFGEYVPLESIFRGAMAFLDLPMSSFISGSDKKGILNLGKLRLKTAICYEIAYPNLVLSHVGESNSLLTVSNDTWFGHSIGPQQHLQIAQFRALESGRPVLRATNSGITAMIDHHGNILKQANSFEEAVLLGQITPRTGSTFISLIGSNNLALLLAVFLICCGYLATRQEAGIYFIRKQS